MVKATQCDVCGVYSAYNMTEVTMPGHGIEGLQGKFDICDDCRIAIREAIMDRQK